MWVVGAVFCSGPGLLIGLDRSSKAAWSFEYLTVRQFTLRYLPPVVFNPVPRMHVFVFDPGRVVDEEAKCMSPAGNDALPPC
jgi:hypothetical protein